jgi:Bacteriophage head to tail connecting protein
MQVNAKSRWAQLDGDRSQMLNRARDCAKLTIPAVCPPLGYTEQMQLPAPYQSLGARGVNNLASKLIMALLPANTSLFRYRVDEDVLAALGASREKVEEVLRTYETKVMLFIETAAMRPMLHQALKHLVVTGNALLHLPKNARPRMFGWTDFVVQRDPDGTVLEIVIREQTLPGALSEAVCAAHGIHRESTSKDKIDIYTRIILDVDASKYTWCQEINGIEVDGSCGRSEADECPYIPLRWQAVYGNSYGIGMVEEYLGDLISHEGLSKAIVQFSAAAAKIIFLLHPNATTDEDALVDAESGEFVTGRKEDIDVLQIDKYADFKVTKDVLDDLTLRLSHAFLLQSGTVRNAERVTAEEIRAQAQELEDVLGGVYTVQSVEMQLPIVKRVMSMLRSSGDLPRFPKISGRPSVVPHIVTGFEALGRSQELNRLRSYFQDLQGILGPQALALFDPRAVAQTFSTSHNVSVDTLLKSADQLKQEQQQAQMAALAEKAAGPVSGAVAKGVMTPQTQPTQ